MEHGGAGRAEVVITTAKEIFLQLIPFTLKAEAEDKRDEYLKRFDKEFKAITKTVSEAFLETFRAKP